MKGELKCHRCARCNGYGCPDMLPGLGGVMGGANFQANCADWKALGERLSGCEIEDFELEKYQREYLEAGERGKDDSFLGKFFLAALAQKSMVTNKIFQSGNRLAGYSVDFRKKGFRGIKDFQRLVEQRRGERE